MAKSPIVADKIKPEELDEAVPPKRECWESSILKLSEDKLVPLEISAKLKTGVKPKIKTENQTVILDTYLIIPHSFFFYDETLNAKSGIL